MNCRERLCSPLVPYLCSLLNLYKNSKDKHPFSTAPNLQTADCEKPALTLLAEALLTCALPVHRKTGVAPIAAGVYYMSFCHFYRRNSIYTRQQRSHCFVNASATVMEHDEKKASRHNVRGEQDNSAQTAMRYWKCSRRLSCRSNCQPTILNGFLFSCCCCCSLRTPSEMRLSYAAKCLPSPSPLAARTRLSGNLIAAIIAAEVNCCCCC